MVWPTLDDYRLTIGAIKRALPYVLDNCLCDVFISGNAACAIFRYGLRPICGIELRIANPVGNRRLISLNIHTANIDIRRKRLDHFGAHMLPIRHYPQKRRLSGISPIAKPKFANLAEQRRKIAVIAHNNDMLYTIRHQVANRIQRKRNIGRILGSVLAEMLNAPHRHSDISELAFHPHLPKDLRISSHIQANYTQRRNIRRPILYQIGEKPLSEILPLQIFHIHIQP